MKQEDLLGYNLYQNKIFFPRIRSRKNQVKGDWFFNFECYVRIELEGKQYLLWVSNDYIAKEELSESYYQSLFIANCYKAKILYRVEVDNVDEVIGLYLDPDQRPEVEKLTEELKRFML